MDFQTSGIDDQLQKLRRGAEEREAQRCAERLNLPYTNLDAVTIEIEALKLIPQGEAEKEQIAAFKKRGDRIFIAAHEPATEEIDTIIKRFAAQKLLAQVTVVSLSSLHRAWGEYKYVTRAEAPLIGHLSINARYVTEIARKVATVESVNNEITHFDSVHFPIVQIFEIIIAGALSNSASDIHFEAEERDVRVRFRLDGRLHDVTRLGRHIYERLLSRVKLLSGIKLNVATEAQDGRFSVELKEKNIEMRVSILPSEFGETVVVRVLDPDTIRLSLHDLGLRADDLAIIDTEIREPNGMLLNTGPTGSGKTTTLYTFLQTIKDPEIEVITIEDPIEYHIEGLEQTQVNEEAGYTFANGLRSIMRQDPDVILVGEIRDTETAWIGIQAALTGHLVFSTVHANSAASAIPRLIDLGAKPQSIGPALNLVIAQRLVRRLCTVCRVHHAVSQELTGKIHTFLKKLPVRVTKDEYKTMTVFKAKGCDACNHTGFKGRIAIFELLRITEEVEAMIRKEITEGEIYRYAIEKQGMVTLQQDGILKILRGITTFEEVESETGHLVF